MFKQTDNWTETHEIAAVCPNVNVILRFGQKIMILIKAL